MAFDGSHLHCGGTVLVHDDRGLTCTDAACCVGASVEATVSFHSSFVACSDVFSEAGCPRCVASRFGRLS